MKKTNLNIKSNTINRLVGLHCLRTSLNVAAFACASLLVITNLADAGIHGQRTVRGNVTFSQDGNRLVVRASNGAIIEYDRLSIEAGQIMQFIQPSSTSRVLNRVTGSELSRIDGTLLSNGIVYLVNPQGFRIGGGAVINVGGFFAAAGAMSNSDFVAGRNRFTNLVGEVTNEGLIQAQSVALVGQYVANRGTIDVGDGYVAMGAGDKVYIQDGTGPVVVTVSRTQMGADGSGAGARAAISNTGTIDAGEGSVTMANGDFYSLAMDLSGTIVGKSIAARAGKGGVLAVNGTLDASSSTGKGGAVDIFGDRVGLFGDAFVNANGATGGGSIRIGGDYLGSNAANAPQASRTFIGDNARITANATQSGNGGRVIVWSNEYTGFFGTIEASAAASGKGGFIETSSHDNLQAFGSVDASSALGQSGTWLLDPSDVVIAAGSAGSLSAGVFDPVGSPASIGVVEINAALNAGTSVIINTASADAGAGNITMTGAISKTAGGDATLTLNAVGTIVLSQSISSTTGALSVALNAGGSVTMESVINTNGGTLAIVAGGAVTQGGASTLTIGGTTSVTTGNAAIALVGAGTNNFVGAVTLTNTGAFDVSVGSNTALTLDAVSAGQNFSATTTSSINVTNTIDTLAGANGGTVTLNGAAGLTIGVLGVITSDGAVNLTGGGTGISTAADITTTGDVVNFNSATTMDGSIAVNTATGAGAGDINFASTLDLYFYNLNLTAGTGSVAFTGAVGDAPGNAIGTITINSAFNVTAAAIQAASFRQLAGTGATTFNGAQTYSALAGLNVVTSGTIALNNTVTTIPLSGGHNGTVTLNGAAGLTIGALGDITSDGAVNLTSAAGISTAGDITTTGAVVNFNSSTILTGNVSIDTTYGGNLAGQEIGFAATVTDGVAAFNLNLNAGTSGVINFSGVNAAGLITINNLTITNAAGANFAGNVQVNDLITTANPYTVSMTGTQNTFTQQIDFLNTGVGSAVTLGNGAVSTFDLLNGLIFTGNAALNLAASIRTTGDAVNFGTGGVTLFGNSVVDTTIGGAALLADITFGGIVADAPGPFNLTLNAGNAGVIAFTGVDALGLLSFHDLTISGAGSATFAGNVQLDNLITTPILYTVSLTGATNSFAQQISFVNIGAVTFGDASSDTFTFNQGMSFGNNAPVNLAATIFSSGDAIHFGGGGVTLLADSSIDTTFGGAALLADITFGSVLGGRFSLDLTAGVGNITFSGGVGVVAPLTTVTVNSAENVNATSAFNVDTLAVTGGVVNFSSTGTGGTITNLVTFANTGDLTLGQALGTQTFTGGLDTTGVGGVVTLLGTINTGAAGNLILGAITLAANTVFDIDGTLTIGAVTGGGFAMNISAGDLILTGNINDVTTLTIQNSDVAGAITLMGIGGLSIDQTEWDFIVTGLGGVTSVVLGNTTTNTGVITIAGAWINDSAVTVDFFATGAGALHVDGDITGVGTLTVHGSGNSTHINADITQEAINIFDSVIVEGGATRTLQATGIGGIVIDTTGFTDGISADVISTNLVLQVTYEPILPADPSAPISVTAAFTTEGGVALNNLTVGGFGFDAGTVNLSASGAIAGDLSINLALGINLNSSTGTLTAGSMFFGEDTTLTGATILVSSVDDIDFGTDLATATFGGAFGITLTVAGTATFSDLINLTGAAGSFAFTGNNLTINGVGTNNIGTTMTVTNAGLFTTYNGGLAPTGADLVVGNDFIQNGAGLNRIGGNITSTADGIAFATGVTLTNDITMTSGLLAGDDITFGTAIRSDVSATRDLTLTAGLGDIALNDGTSTTTLLDAILINSARNVVVGDAITATSFTQLAGTGSTTFEGALDFTGALTVNCGTSSNNTITFANTVGSVSAGSVNLNTLASSARATPAIVATIVSSGDIEFATNSFTMGQNHKLTSLGDIAIVGLSSANATSVTLGDVNAVGNFVVNSDAIALRARAAGQIVTNTGGAIEDPMIGIVVGGQVFFSVAPVMIGSGSRAVFSSSSGNVDGSGTLGGFAWTVYQSPITVALLTGAGGRILDLSAASAVSTFNPAYIIPPSFSILPPMGVLGSSGELDENKKARSSSGKPNGKGSGSNPDGNQGAKKTASESTNAPVGVPVALR